MILAARREAGFADALATVGRVEVHPGATNSIASSATAWLDVRAPTAQTARKLADDITSIIASEAGDHMVELVRAEESWSDGTDFLMPLRERLAVCVKATLGAAPLLATGAGHDAAVLASRLPTAMLFVRNPTGTSHDAGESANLEDCLAGVDALTAVMANLIDDDSVSGGSQ
jgi:N-carbamoyl-L-amino-acid hydrolase